MTCIAISSTLGKNHLQQADQIIDGISKIREFLEKDSGAKVWIILKIESEGEVLMGDSFIPLLYIVN